MSRPAIAERARTRRDYALHQALAYAEAHGRDPRHGPLVDVFRFDPAFDPLLRDVKVLTVAGPTWLVDAVDGAIQRLFREHGQGVVSCPERPV